MTINKWEDVKRSRLSEEQLEAIDTRVNLALTASAVRIPRAFWLRSLRLPNERLLPTEVT